MSIHDFVKNLDLRHSVYIKTGLKNTLLSKLNLNGITEIWDALYIKSWTIVIFHFIVNRTRTLMGLIENPE